MVESTLWKGRRFVARACICFLSQACAPSPPEPPAASAFGLADLERLVRLQQSLDQLNAQLDGGESSPSAIDAIRQDLEEFLGSMGQESQLPFKANLERVVATLSESNGQPSGEQQNDVREEILAMVEWIEVIGEAPALAGPGPAGRGPAQPARGSPGPGAGPGARPGPGPPGAFGGSGGAPTDQVRLEVERKQRSAEEAVWRARAKATRAAVVQTRSLYEQTMSIQPRPGDSPAMIEQSQAAAKAAMEAAEQAEVDLREEARRAGALPGWLR